MARPMAVNDAPQLARPLLSWTGHPLPDMGIAILTAFAGRDRPEEVTAADLEAFAEYAEKAFLSPGAKGHHTVLFTVNLVHNPNSKWTEQRKREKAAEVLREYRLAGNSDLPRCAYCNRQAVKAYAREYVPMLTGQGVINFFPGGRAGLPLCGSCIVALQALAIGAPSCEGRALIVAAADPALTLALVRHWLPELRKRIALSQASGQKPTTMGKLRSRIIEALCEVQGQAQPWVEQEALKGTSGDEEIPAPSLTVYHLSNSGQGPTIDIHELSGSIVRFVTRAGLARYRQAWQVLVRRAWQRVETKGKKGSKQAGAAVEQADDDPFRRCNYLYEDLFGLPENAACFIRRYLRPRDMTGQEEAEFVPTWRLTELFLEEVMGMEAKRIEAIRALADGLSEKIAQTDDKALWKKAYFNKGGYRGLRSLVIGQGQQLLKEGRPPLLRFDDFLTIFEDGNELAKTDWGLAWDLVLIRMTEQLYDRGWFERHKDVLAETTEEAEREEE